MNVAAIVALGFEVGSSIAQAVMRAIENRDEEELRRLANVCPSPLKSRLELEAIKAAAAQSEDS